MTGIETQARNNFSKHIQIIEEQNKAFREVFKDVNHHYDYNICIPLSAASLMSTYSVDVIKKQETVLDLTLEGRYSEASIILRRIMEDVIEMMHLADNPLYYKVFVFHKSIEEKRAQGIIDSDTPQTKFNKTTKQLFQEVDEEDLYPLYRTLSQSEAHTGVQVMRDNIIIKKNNMSLKLEREFEERRTASILYTLFVMMDKLYDVIEFTISYKTHNNSTLDKYRSSRNQYRNKMDKLYKSQNLGRMSP